MAYDLVMNIRNSEGAALGTYDCPSWLCRVPRFYKWQVRHDHQLVRAVQDVWRHYARHAVAVRIRRHPPEMPATGQANDLAALDRPRPLAVQHISRWRRESQLLVRRPSAICISRTHDKRDVGVATSYL